MGKETRIRKYKTHPLVGAALALSLLLTAAVCAASFGFYMYVEKQNREALEMREKCAEEAYLCLCENLGLREMRAAAEALSRLELFGGCGEADDLRAAIISGNVDEETAEALREALDGSATVYEAVADADRAAGKTLVESDTAAGGGSWAALRDLDEIGTNEAHKLASRYVGGGVTLEQAENRTFPPVYTFMCKNASADITRAGGKLLRMYVYRHGGAVEKSDEHCRAAAEKFIESAGVKGAVLVSEEAGEDEVGYVFAGSFSLGDETVVCPDETVKVGVSRRGAAVCFFDAAVYYREKPASHDVDLPSVSRAQAAKSLGVDPENLTLVYTENRLFWRLGGVKTLLLDAQTGEIRVQNP